METPPSEPEIEYRGSAFPLREVWTAAANDFTRFVWMIRTPAFLLLSLISFAKRWAVSQSLEEWEGVDVCLGALILAQHYAGQFLPRRFAAPFDMNELHRALYVLFTVSMVVASYNTENNDLLKEVSAQDRIPRFVFLKNRDLYDRFKLPDIALASCRSLQFGDLRHPYQGDVNREFIQTTIAAAAQLRSFTGYGNAINNESISVLVEKQSETLDSLELGLTSLDSEHLKKIAKLKNLRKLQFQATTLDAAVLAEILRGCENLETLSLQRAKVNGELVLPKNSKLQHLQILNSKLEPEAITELLGKTTLISFALDDETYLLTEHATANLAKIVQLDLVGSKYNDQALRDLLQKCPELKTLELFSTSVTDEGLKLVKESKLQHAVIYDNAGEHRLK